MRARGAVLVTSALVAAGCIAAVLVPPALAQVPSAPLQSDTTITLRSPNGDGRALVASVSVSAGWTRVGMGPFMPEDRTTLISPDGTYRVELRLVEAPPSSTEHAGETSEQLEAPTDAAGWSTESLGTGNEVRHTTVVHGGDSVTVAIVDPPPVIPSVEEETAPRETHLVLVAEVPAGEAERYRTVTADLVASAVFTAPGQSAGPLEVQQ